MSDDTNPTISHESMNAPSSQLDKIGIAASLACAVHCLVAPFFLLLLPAAGSIWSHPVVHWILAALVLPVALYVIYRGYIRHNRRAAILSAVLGATFVVMGLLVPNDMFNTGTATAMAATAEPTAPSQQPVACTKSCCPTVVQDPDTGALKFNLPPASIATVIGSVLLVFAHALNLHGCHTVNKTNVPLAGDCDQCADCNRNEKQGSKQ